VSEALAIAAARERLRYDTPFWAGGLTRAADGTWLRPGPTAFQGVARIVDKSRQLVPLIGSDPQLEFDQALEGQRAAGLPMRAIILKARQLGFSTWTEAKIAQRVTQLPYQNAVVVAHEVKAAGSIFNMTERMHTHLPTEEELGLGFSIKPAIVGRSFSDNGRKHLAFGEPSRRLREAGRSWTSTLSVDTAQSPESGRSETRNLVHLSEVAKWPERATQGTQSKMISVLNSVPYLPETLVVLESTANGLNHFYRRWVSAREGVKDPDTGETYVPIFVAWWRDPSYAMQFSSDEARARFVDGIGTGPYGEDEVPLVELYGCTPEQLLWRRMQIRTQHEDNVELFKQEYPASDEEAFIGSGNPVFPGILVGRAIKAVESAPEPVKGTLREAETVTRKTRGGTIEIPTRVLWVPEDECARDEPLLSVWEHPRGGEQIDVDDDMDLRLMPPAAVAAEKQQREAALREALERGPGQYVVAADIAEGESNTFTSGDFHAVHVLDHVTKTQVAEYESHLDLHLLPRWIFLIALYYNEAILGVERNGPGVAVVEPLKNDLRYRRLYKQRKVDQQQSHKVREKIGWTTDQVTKPELEVTFAQALQEETHGLRSIRCARQLNTYVEDDRGRHGAQAGEHDDLLMAAMIARRIAVLMQPRRPKSGRRFVPDDELTGY
jgi:hypothetical protein